MTQTKQPKTGSKFTPGAAETDWRPKQMHDLPKNDGYPRCSCHTHYGANFQEFIFCPLHAKAPEMYELLSTVIDWYEDSGSTEPCAGSVDLWSEARRIKAAIDGEG